MSPWEPSWETGIRRDVARSAYRRPETSTNMTSDKRVQQTVKRDRTMRAGDGSSRTDDGVPHPEIARCSDAAAGTRGADRSCESAVEAQQHGDGVIVLLGGQFDLVAADPIREALTRAIGEPGRWLIVDLSEVTFIDSSGLHVILDAYKLCRDARLTLKIRPGPPNVQRVFELTNLLDYLPFEGGD